MNAKTSTSAVEGDILPTRFAVAQNHPNPFNPSTTISFAVPENAGQVSLAIFDVSGRLVRTLESSSLPAGTYTRDWNGRDDPDRVGQFRHLLLSSVGELDFSEAKKMILLQ